MSTAFQGTVALTYTEGSDSSSICNAERGIERSTHPAPMPASVTAYAGKHLHPEFQNGCMSNVLGPILWSVGPFAVLCGLTWNRRSMRVQ